MEKKTTLWVLIIITFIILIIIWQFFLRIFPRKEGKEFMEVFNFETNFDIKKIFQEIENYNFFQIFKKSNNEPKRELTNEEIERLKEKVLKYINSQ